MTDFSPVTAAVIFVTYVAVDMMERKAVEAMCQIAQILVTVKGMAASCDRPLQRMIKEQLGNCQEIMANYCDSSPFKLMTGMVDEIMENHEYVKSLQQTA